MIRGCLELSLGMFVKSIAGEFFPTLAVVAAITIILIGFSCP